MAVSLAVAYGLALVDLRLGSGSGALLATALLLFRAKTPPARAIISALIAAAIAAWLAWAARAIVEPAWPEASRYTAHPLLALVLTSIAGALAISDALKSARSGASAP
jgi:hypothetical protein